MEPPYYFFGDYLTKKYKCRVLKLPININLSCPNRDGSLGTEGCIFCSDEGSASPVIAGIEDIVQQMENGRESFRRSAPDTKYIAYFQAYTNTYSSPAYLKKMYDSALNHEDVIGLMIGTRPDCLPNDIIDLIASYRRNDFELWLEIGMQSVHNKSLDFLNRRHDHNSTADAVTRASKLQIPICLHVILGIPGESWEDMMETARVISAMPVKGVKIHHLHVIRGTKLESLFQEKKITIISMKEYVSTICDFIERLRPDILIHRLIGDRSIDSLVSPKWALHKGTVLKEIENEFNKRGTYQGFLYQDDFE